MSEQPPRASTHVPLPGELDAPQDRLEIDPEAPEPGSATAGEPLHDPFVAQPATAGSALGQEPEERVRTRTSEGLDRAADAARRLGHRAREQGGIAGRAEPLAYRVGDSLQSAASYVRANDLRGMRDDVEEGVHRSPLKALAVAALGGFLLGRMLR